MNHNFVLNTLSLPAGGAAHAYDALYSALKGMLAVGHEEDRFTLFCDSDRTLMDLVVSTDYTYRDFLSELGARGEEDLLLALFEINDKSPVIDLLNDEELDKVASRAFYFPDEGYEKSIDVLAIAWAMDAILLSLATNAKWQRSEIEFAQYSDHEISRGVSILRNVSSEADGRALRLRYDQLAEMTYDDLFPNCRFSEPFQDWVKALADDLQTRIGEKIALAYGRNFEGGEPLFKTLNDADGMREIRFGAVQGGAVRILFGGLPGGKQAILVGFVKKSDAGGYKEAIKAGAKLWSSFIKEAQVPTLAHR